MNVSFLALTTKRSSGIRGERAEGHKTYLSLRHGFNIYSFLRTSEVTLLDTSKVEGFFMMFFLLSLIFFTNIKIEGLHFEKPLGRMTDQMERKFFHRAPSACRQKSDKRTSRSREFQPRLVLSEWRRKGQCWIFVLFAPSTQCIPKFLWISKP